MTRSNRLRGAIDIDDTVFPFTPNWLDFYNQTYGTSHDLVNLRSYSLEDFVGRDTDHVTQAIDQFLAIDHRAIRPLEHSVEGVEDLFQDYELFGLTARSSQHASLTAEWLRYYFGDMIPEVIHTEPGQSKGQICKERGAKFLVDNYVKYTRECVEADVACVIFGRYHWIPQPKQLPKRTLVAANWLEVPPAVRRLVPARLAG